MSSASCHLQLEMPTIHVSIYAQLEIQSNLSTLVHLYPDS